MTDSPPPFACTHCDGVVDLAPERRSYFEQRLGINIEVPASFVTASCSKCGVLYLSSADAAFVEESILRLIETVKREGT